MIWLIRFCHERRHRRHHHHIRVALVIGNVAVELTPNGVNHMATSMNVGQSVPFSLAFFDQNGQPMAVTPTPDAAPVWSQTSSSVETLTAAPDGLTASAAGVAAGTDTVKVELAVGGVSFSATIDSTVNAVAPSQTLTSIGIVAGTPTP